MIRIYLPPPTPAWGSDPIGMMALKTWGLCWFLGGVAAFISVWGN